MAGSAEAPVSLCVSVDVEDWYDGMAVLGHEIPTPSGALSGLGGLAALLETSAQKRSCTLTLFVVGNYLERVLPELNSLAAAGHEIASHGPDHGRMPPAGPALREWLRKGRDYLEQRLQVPVRGFRSPRFDVPAGISLAAYRHELADAGYAYVSDTSRFGTASPIAELPVLRVGRFPLGGGSYQRLLPSSAVVSTLAPRIASKTETPVLYYHSYDFGATLPRAGGSPAVAAQTVARRRIPMILSDVLAHYGSRSCADAALTSPKGHVS